ncbi:MAG: flagellar basal body rod protein FlgB [Proteobacteria bacterium]|nr:flagellar basal body rod protein FlgB [Pseudomonadota bacterium]
MDLNKIPVMDAIVKKMNWLNRRQRVIADNVANADTPGYVARDLKPQDFSGLLQQAPRSGAARGKPRMTITNARHMTAGGGGGVKGGKGTVVSESHEASPTGNTVILEEQMIKMASTQMEYGKMVSLYRRHVGLLKASLGRGQR